MTTSPEPTGAGITHAHDTPLHEVTDALDQRGHDGQFEALEGGEIACLTCGRHFPASGQSADRATRLEGDSDPSDMTMVVPVTCPHCHTAGALIARYGPEASAADADVLVALPRDAHRPGTAPVTVSGPTETNATRTDDRSKPSRPHAPWLMRGAFAAPVIAAAVIGSRVGPQSAGTGRWYRKLAKPPFQPPAAAFAPVWTALYAGIAESGYRVWRAPDDPWRTRALGLWGAQMAANAAFVPVFFGARRPKAALGVLGVQVAATAAYMAAARHVDRPAAALMAPYLAWSGFAGALNEEIVRRNPDA